MFAKLTNNNTWYTCGLDRNIKGNLESSKAIDTQNAHQTSTNLRKTQRWQGSVPKRYK
jgi:hypothetical protein